MAKPISRRTMLRGAGAAIALPWLEIMSPIKGSLSQSAYSHTADLNRNLNVNANPNPKRIAFMYIPNGVIGAKWFPSAAGQEFDFTPSLQPLEKFRDDITVISGLNRTYLTGEPHSQAGSCWLTSSLPSERSDGVTAIDRTLDQFIAANVGGATAFPSIELSCNSFVDNMEPKLFDSISWYGPGNDARSQNDPRKVFQRLFGESQQIQKSVLDTVLEDAKDLQKRLGKGDQRKLDEYLNSVRAIEQRMQRQLESKGRVGKLDYNLPEEIPTNRGEFIRMMGDLMVLAFQTDQTRVATMMVGPERWETPQLYDGVFEKPVNHHVMTHDPEYDEQVSLIDKFHVAQYAYLINRLKSVPEGDGTLLDSCSFVLGSGLGNGARHSYEQLPVIIAGNGGGRMETGRHLAAGEGTRLANLWLSLANNMGLNLDRFADSTGELKGLLKS
jgi:hypothetical protein